ncbi:MAG: phosphoribosylformylglycinamidine synthase subunit PurQ, partial [Xanthobacteraceae bacterium]
MRSAVVVFPGINRERDMARALRLISGREPALAW